MSLPSLDGDDLGTAPPGSLGLLGCGTILSLQEEPGETAADSTCRSAPPPGLGICVFVGVNLNLGGCREGFGCSLHVWGGRLGRA